MDKSVDEFLPEILELELETYLLFGFCILEFKRYIKTKVEVPSVPIFGKFVLFP
jgi:hypothetical protein